MRVFFFCVFFATVCDAALDPSWSFSAPSFLATNEQVFGSLSSGGNEQRSVYVFARDLNDQATLLKYLPSGALDQSFGVNGIKQLGLVARPLELDTRNDGMIVAAMIRQDLSNTTTIVGMDQQGDLLPSFGQVTVNDVFVAILQIVGNGKDGLIIGAGFEGIPGEFPPWKVSKATKFFSLVVLFSSDLSFICENGMPMELRRLDLERMGK
jgi:hypothetical protein